MFPHFTSDGIVPPYVGGDPTIPATMSPYRVTMPQFVEWFGYNRARLDILGRLLDYRELLTATGVVGFQWLSGSFVEDVEKLRQRPPGDVDIVSVVHRPPNATDDTDWISFLGGASGYLFKNKEIKRVFGCDGYVIDLNDQVEDVVDLTRYWIGLFSHQRDTSFWKGMMAVELNQQMDSQARTVLQAKLATTP